MDTWTSIESGRKAFAEYLASLSDEEWSRPSLCAGWSVKNVAAHMLVIPTMGKGTIFSTFLGSGFNLDKMNGKFVERISAELTPAQIAAKTAASAGSRTRPPGLNLPGVLTELAVHTSDVSEGSGKPFALPTDTYVAALDHLKDTQPVFGTKKRIAGLTLRATDAGWSTGSGPVVEGTARDLTLAITGRPIGLDRLSGPGLDTLRSR